MKSALYIGRFQPFHKGHLSVVQQILADGNDRVILAMGSAEKSFLPGNPLTAAERFQIIEESLLEAGIKGEQFAIIPIRNVNNYALWVNHVNSYVPPYEKLYTGSEIVRACYEGKYNKSHRATKIGPEIIELDRSLVPISATEVRQAMLEDKGWENLIPPAAARLLADWDILTRLQTIKHTRDHTKYNNRY